MFEKLHAALRRQKKLVDTATDDVIAKLSAVALRNGKSEALTPDERGILELLINDIQEALPQGEAKVNEVLKTWITVNDLHPDEVRSLTVEEFNREFGARVSV
jgi:DNA replication initiation complex subunit (GINS family)